MRKWWVELQPDTRRILIKAVAYTIGVVMLSAVAIVAIIAKSGGLESLFKLIEALA